MEALILSCSTGGGHNAAGFAIKEELESRGHSVTMMDPYELESHKLAVEIGNAYVKLVQKTPRTFGFVYMLGSLVRRAPGKSPVYYANITVAKKLKKYLDTHHTDAIIMPHLFPAELVTYLKKKGVKLPLTVFVATDYTCIPFTEETDCDYYVIPGEAQKKEFIKRKIPKDKLLTFGIPVRKEFSDEISMESARDELKLSQDKRYVLLTGGSIGAGSISKSIDIIIKHFKENNIPGEVIVVCGNNKKLIGSLRKRAKKYYDGKLTVIGKTDRMALYMRACDVFISKPGGLSSTEAAVLGTAYIHITPIPGCETKNMRYFSKCGMSIAVNNPQRSLAKALDQCMDRKKAEDMKKSQHTNIPLHAREDICDWIENVCG